VLVQVLEVTTLLSGDPGPVLITADGLCGWGSWQGGPRPAIGDKVDVELASNAEINWEADVLVDFPVDLPQDPAPGRMLITGAVEDIDAQGVLTMRVADGMPRFTLAGLDGPAELAPALVGGVVRVIAQQVDIHPTVT
jgi:hypothetical protein